MDKQELRDRMKLALRQADREELAAVDAEVCRRVRERPEFQAARVVLSYAPFGREFDVTDLNRAVLASGRILCLPLITGQGLMEARQVHSLDELVAGKYGILAPPEESPRIEPERIELALVPGLAFGPERQRLGRGGGFYDRWLAAFPGRTIAPTRELQLAPEIPCQSWDARPDMVITELRVLC